jgi:hypothetical protein
LQVDAGRVDAEIRHGRVAMKKAGGSVVGARCFVSSGKAA